MRTETQNLLRQNSVDAIEWNNSSLTSWNSDPVGIGTTFTDKYSESTNETLEFLKDAVRSIKNHTDLIAKLDELHGV